MPKKVALCVGQNKYQRPDINTLRGCVNDALLIGEMLRKAGFEVRQVHNEVATQRGILDRLSTEVAKLREGDYFVFWNSSHGYQVQDREHDELYDYMDEAICSYDTDPRDPLTDDKFGRILYRANPEAHIFLGSDSCHSGTLTRAALAVRGGLMSRYQASKLWIPPDDIRFRSNHVISLDDFVDSEYPTLYTMPLREGVNEVRRFGRLGRDMQDTDMNHVLLSGCRSDQTSADAKFREGFYGAMTYYFAKAVLKAWKSGKGITYREAREQAIKVLEQGEFDQVPQLEGPDRLKDELVFGYKP